MALVAAGMAVMTLAGPASPPVPAHPAPPATPAPTRLAPPVAPHAEGDMLLKFRPQSTLGALLRPSGVGGWLETLSLLVFTGFVGRATAVMGAARGASDPE